MRPRGTGAIPLPARPNLEQYRNRAKALVKACQSGDPDALRAWARQWLTALGELPDRDGKKHPWSEKHIEREVQDIEKDARSSRLLGDDGSPATCTLADAQLFLARLHDFVSWPRFAHHVAALSIASSPDVEFETAADAVVDGDVPKLRAMLTANPALIRARSSRDHGATLLHYTASNGHEGFRQRTPPNAVDVATLLLDAGAEVDALAHMYYVQTTTMDMLVSSTPPHDAGLQVALVHRLVDYGAAVNGVEDNSSPLMTALAFGFPRSAEALAMRGARIDNIITAASLGDVDIVTALVDDSGHLRPDAKLANVHWPKLPRDPAVHLAYAVAWAASFGRTEVVRVLLRKGVSAESADNNMPAIHQAAAHGHLEIVRMLLAHGASLETLNSYGGTVLSSTMWFARNAADPGVDYKAVIRELIAAGARTDVYPEMQGYIDTILERG
jgi:ankyrin repeat protein